MVEPSFVSPTMNVTGLNWWSVNIGSGNGGAVRQQAITWANVDPDRCRHMASLGPNELNQYMGWYIVTLEHHACLGAIFTWLSYKIMYQHLGYNWFNTVRLEQYHWDICKQHFEMDLLENCYILMPVSLKFVPNDPIGNTLGLVHYNGLVRNRLQAITPENDNPVLCSYISH